MLLTFSSPVNPDTTIIMTGKFAERLWAPQPNSSTLAFSASLDPDPLQPTNVFVLQVRSEVGAWESPPCLVRANCGECDIGTVSFG